MILLFIQPKLSELQSCDSFYPGPSVLNLVHYVLGITPLAAAGVNARVADSRARADQAAALAVNERRTTSEGFGHRHPNHQVEFNAGGVRFSPAAGVLERQLILPPPRIPSLKHKRALSLGERGGERPSPCQGEGMGMRADAAVVTLTPAQLCGAAPFPKREGALARKEWK
jgi:hypothetical protein